MRELKGDWKDLFNGFMLALDLRKMFLGFCAILFTALLLGGTVLWARQLDEKYVEKPKSFVPTELWSSASRALHTIYSGTTDVGGTYEAQWFVYVPHGLLFSILLVAIWSYFGGAISRIAAYEIAKDGERLETARALKFSRKKFWAFFMAPVICVIGFLFFAFCNAAGGFIGRLLDFGWVGSPLVALFLPLALLSGFIMALIVVGSLGGSPLFMPAVATEGTDAFDAVSRGFSYVYARPWHYLWYQLVQLVYGTISITFVLVFAFLLCSLAIKAGAVGFDAAFSKPDPHAPAPKEGAELSRFEHVADASWTLLLDPTYEEGPNPGDLARVVRNPDMLPDALCPYPWVMRGAHVVTGHTSRHQLKIDDLPKSQHRIAAYILLAWLIFTLGIAWGYVPSYLISQQTAIYYLMRKKVDGIEMNEVFEEAEEEEALQPVPPPGESKPGEPPPAKEETAAKPPDAPPPSGESGGESKPT